MQIAKLTEIDKKEETRSNQCRKEYKAQPIK